MTAKFQFSNVVVVERDQIGVIVKTWKSQKTGYNYDVYVRSFNAIHNYSENQIDHFIFSKYLDEDELSFYDKTFLP
jgi:hypothetical protein